VSHPVVERVLSGEVPASVRLTAAQGLLPIPREDQIELWTCLRNDEDPAVRAACRENLAAVTSNEWRAILPEAAFRPEFFDFASKVLARAPDLAESLLRNKAVPDEALIHLAGTARGQVLDQIMDLQNRLLAQPDIVVAMLQNAAVSQSQARRLFDLAEQFFRGHSAIPKLLRERFGLAIGHAGGEFAPAHDAGPPVAAAPQKTSSVQLPPQRMAEEVSKEPAPLTRPGAALPAGPQAATAEAVEAEEEAASEEERRTLYEKLLTMSVPEKISLAVRGDKEARTLLMRDSNKVVQEAVMDSPKLTDGEVEAIAKMRNLPEELLRKIARNGEWMKRYAVIHGLVTNPKTPLGIAMPLVSRLNDFDIKNLVRDKNVSDLIRREARKIYDLRHTPKKVNYKKGK
jgi:hypothetical protein